MCNCGKMSKPKPAVSTPQQSSLPNMTTGTNQLLISQLKQQQQLNHLTQRRILPQQPKIVK